MSTVAVAKTEFRGALRANTLLGLTALFAVWAAFLAAIGHVPALYPDRPGPTSTLVLLNSMRQSTVFFVPAVGIALGYDAIVGGRDRGTLGLALSLPNSRGEVLRGKFLGLSAVVGAAVLVGYATAGLVTLATTGSFALALFGWYTALTVGYGAVYVALAVGVSAFLRSRERALGVAFGLYALFMLLWDVLVVVVKILTLGGGLRDGGQPAWLEFLLVLNPSSAFAYAARATIPEYHYLTAFPESDAAYVQDWVGFVVLAAWTVLPLGLGYVRFSRMDI